MNLNLNCNLKKDYKSSQQKIRCITGQWIKDNMFCPICGYPNLTKYKNNKPVADFFAKNANLILN